jgi:hypothetical protein
VWVMVPFSPDWRWQLDREDSPWYPSLKIFRQLRRGQWGDVIERVTETLQREFKTRSISPVKPRPVVAPESPPP